MSDNETPRVTPLSIAPPSPARAPLKVNVFNHMRTSNTALCPLFPYLDEGCFAPATAIFTGAPGRTLGMFKHFNTVDEILVIFGSEGFRFKPGTTMADVRTHVVNIALNDNNDPRHYMCGVVVQRQSENRHDQREAVTFICEKCHKPLLEVAFPSQPEAPGSARVEYAGGFETPIGAWRAASQFNADDASRTCKHCGHVSAQFPLKEWGWDKYAEQCRVADSALERYPGLQAVATHGEGASRA